MDAPQRHPPHRALRREATAVGGGRAERSCGGMVIGMATRKVTVTLDEGQVAAIRDLVANGRASSVSGFVQHAVGVALDDVAGWGAVLAEALAATGGGLTAEERQWADGVLGTGKKRGKRSAA
jgi:Arc/MetJ-type ribon-helix-helix transcriptional regulator